MANVVGTAGTRPVFVKGRGIEADNVFMTVEDIAHSEFKGKWPTLFAKADGNWKNLKDAVLT